LFGRTPLKVQNDHMFYDPLATHMVQRVFVGWADLYESLRVAAHTKEEFNPFVVPWHLHAGNLF